MKTFKQFIGEEGYDRMRDDRLVKYGIGHDGSDRRAGSSKRTPDNQKIKGKTVLQKETEKKYGKGVSALDVVRKKMEAKHGKGIKQVRRRKMDHLCTKLLIILRVKDINAILKRVKQKKGKGVREFVEKELLCHQEVISVERTLKNGMLLT